jgi:hypothetical protein
MAPSTRYSSRPGTGITLEPRGVAYIPTDDPPSIEFDREWELFVVQLKRATGLHEPNAGAMAADVVWGANFEPLFFRPGKLGVEEIVYKTERPQHRLCD